MGLHCNRHDESTFNNANDRFGPFQVKHSLFNTFARVIDLKEAIVRILE